MVCNQIIKTCQAIPNYSIDRIDPKGQVIPNQSNYQLITRDPHVFDARLIFKKVKREHFGIYKFLVNNSAGAMIREINFTLKGNTFREIFYILKLFDLKRSECLLQTLIIYHGIEIKQLDFDFCR
jgi:hypothetical protein